MVVTLLPATCDTGVEQDRIALPSTCTVQAPQSPAPQPNFVPVSSSVSRKTQRRGVSGGTLTLRSLPLTRKVMSAMGVQVVSWKLHNMVLVWREKANGDAAGEASLLASVLNFRSDAIADLGGKAIEGRNLEQAKSDLGTWFDCGACLIV